ncbi:MAG: RecQ family ATP-dependent DNA helicase, partial [Myxococcota bacterium]
MTRSHEDRLLPRILGLAIAKGMDSAAIDATGTDLIADALERYFGFREFRRGQREVVEAIVEGRPTLAVMPTGAGKSLCYQLPAMLLDGVTVVVSPLIALMKDQVDALRERGIAAAYINSTVPLPEQRQALDDAASGRLKLLYLTPERFRFGGAMAAIKRLPIALFAVDEAHCISSWGHDFRPDYMNLGNVVRELDVPRVAAFTATATAKVRIDIVDSLGFVDPTVKVAGFLRDNLHLAVTPIRKMKEKQVYLRQILDQATGPAIVYCATRKNCEEVAHYVKAAGRPVATYHGGMADAARSDAQDRFQSVENICIVATNAFGMGVDKANVRVVVHWDIPGSLDAYYQEAGRAGRDGKPAHCFLLFTYADTRIHEFFIDKGGEALAPDSRVAYAEMERSKLKAMVRYAYADECRHGAILRYFGDRPERCGSGTGATCDNCNGDVGEIGLDAPKAGSLKPSIRDVRVEPRILTEDEEIIVQKVLSAVARSNGRLKKREICRVLRG